MFPFSWIYALIVRSGILYRFATFFGQLHFMFLYKTHNGDVVTDDAGETMRVTKWNGRTLTPFSKRMYNKIKTLNIRKNDIMICGYPKTGCHWMHEVLYMLVNKSPEVSKYGKVLDGMMDALPEVMIDSVPSPRILNSHLLFHELPKGIEDNETKIVLTIRCPKDTVVSFYNHTRNLPMFYDYHGTFENYFKMFIRQQLDYGGYFDFYRSWEKVMKSEQTNKCQIYFVAYEDMREHPVSKIMEIAEFLGEPVSREFAERIADVTSFSRLKSKREGNKLFRKGVVGDWKEWLTDKQTEEMNMMWREKMSGFQMPPGSARVYCN